MKFRYKIFSAVVGVMSSTAAFAQEVPAPPDFTTLTSGIDVSTITTSIMAVAAVMVGVHLAWKGVQFITRAVKGA